jgi:uncharacterized protein YndB with AHSA1/START domain
MRFTNTVTIARPRSEVFAFLANFENVPRWNYAITETRQVSNGPMGVGTRFLQTRTLPARSTESLEVTEFEPERMLAMRGTFGPLPALTTYTLESLGDATCVTNAVVLERAGPLSLLGPLVTSRVKAAVAANLGQLKQVLESHTA